MSFTGLTQYNLRTVIHSGPGAIIRLPALFEGMGAKRVLLLSDRGLKNVGIVDKVIEVFNQTESNQCKLVGVYHEIAPDAACDTVNQATKYAREVAADAILALGGGSVQDAAKGVKYALQHSHIDIRDAIQAGMKFDTWPAGKHSGIWHIGVATTAGTGAEVSCGAVLYNEEAGIKGNLVAPFLDPDMAILDPNLTLGLPRGLTASTGMDALTHALEAVASPMQNSFSDANAMTAAQTIEQQLPVVCKNGADVVARGKMLDASALAITGFFAALNAVPVHNCAHAFGALYHIPHGDANGVLLPICIDVMREYYHPSAHRLAKALNLDVDAGEDADKVLDKVVARLQAFQAEIGCHNSFAKWEIPAADLPKILMAVAMDPIAAFYQIHPDWLQKICERAIG